jgi:hypothetical protein
MNCINCEHYEDVDQDYAQYRRCKLAKYWHKGSEGKLVRPEWCPLPKEVA